MVKSDRRTDDGTLELVDEISKLELTIELAWGLIANSYGGDWSLASDDWKHAAERWRDELWGGQ